MPIGVIPLDAVAEPKNRCHPQRVAEFFFNRRTIFRGIPVGIKKAALGGEHGSFAIHIDRAAFEDEVGIVKNWNVQSLRHGGRHRVVLVKRRELEAPGVETKIQRGDLRFLVANQKNRAVIPAPRLIGGNMEKLQTLRRAFFQKSANCFFLLRILNIDADSLRLGERVGHRDKSRDHAVVGIRKAVAAGLRPRNPSRFMGLPFGGHPVSFFGWSLVRHSSPSIHAKPLREQGETKKNKRCFAGLSPGRCRS